MAPTLYYWKGSSPCHQVIFTAKVLNLDLELKTVNTIAKENMKPEFLKLNPQHTIPTLVDGDFSLWESRAISRYLVNKYAPGSKLYPQDPQARAVVDQRLDFDFGTLSKSFAEYIYPTFFEPNKKPDEAKLKKLEEALGFLNNFLEGTKYAAGDDLTLADVALVASVSVIEVNDIDLKPFPNVVRWLNLVKTTPGYQEAIQDNVDAYERLVADFRASRA